MKLYGYWRSTTSYRARIALNRKGVADETVAVKLGEGAHQRADYLALNPLGDVPTVADLCLIPQLYNARRWGLDLSAQPRLSEIETRCLSLAAFDKARPEAQPDAA